VLQLPSERAGADAILEVRSEQREKIVAGLNAAGQVREFQLRLRLRFRLITPQGRELIPETEIALQREIGFAESAALAKEEEETLLYRDMRADMLQQVLRRLASVTTLQLGTAPLER
jgi:LPS-assembly lipoprotein